MNGTITGGIVGMRIGRAPLTDRQREIYDWIAAYYRANGSSPAIREIAKRFGIKSTNGVNDHLLSMERKGWIKLRGGGRARQIQVLSVSGECPYCGAHKSSGAPS